MTYFVPRLLEAQVPGSYASYFHYSIEPYAGCNFRCTFCFVPHKTNYLQEVGRWGKWRQNQRADEISADIDAKLNGARILLAGRTDAWQPAERKRELTRRILQNLVGRRFEFLLASTRSTLIKRDMDLLEKMRERILVSISINTDDAQLLATTEPITSSMPERLRVARLLVERGIPVRVAVAPVLRHSPYFFETLLQNVPSLWIDELDPATRLRPELMSAIYNGPELTSLLEDLRARFGKDRISFGRQAFSGRPSILPGAVS